MKNTFAKQYGELEQWHWWFRGRRRIIESILRRELGATGGAAAARRILSVGCGPAEGLTWLKPFAGYGGTIFGLDMEPTHAERVPEGVAFVVGRLEDAPYADASFDAVLALDVLEHLDDDAAGLREAVRMVKPDGLLLVTVPALPSLWGGQDVVSEHRRRYTKQTLTRLFDGAGLTGYRVSYFNTLLFPLVASVRLARRAAGSAERVRSDFEDSRPGLVNELLTWVFSLERAAINSAPLPIGVSLIVTCRVPAARAAAASWGGQSH
jgi:SAM-dependent methyltransferase